MKLTLLTLILLTSMLGCTTAKNEQADQEATVTETISLDVVAPDPLPVPQRREPKSETDWEARVHNKEIEVIETINILNPVAAYIKEGFNRYGKQFSGSLHEEWKDTQKQLTSAMNLYEDCKKRRANGKFDKSLFLDLEGVWQFLVKTGVAGIRTKTMVDAELQKIAGG